MKPCVFINLADAAGRRASLEASSAAAAHDGWTLEGFEALGPADVAATPGALGSAAKACFASHRAVIAAHLEDEAPLFVAEDDTVFSRGAFAAVDRLLGQAHDWDVLFTDVALCDLAMMVHLSRRRDALVAAGEVLAANLAGRNFFGANAYVVRGSAKRRLHDLLSEPAALDRPYDLFLRDLAAQGRLKLGCAFPFVTRLSAHAEATQIQGAEAPVFDRTLNAWRRLMAVERDLPAVGAEIAELSGALATQDSRAVGEVFAILASPGFPLTRAD
jgi:GR25 family glycosyltransferase involved in LPS biosynthesis